MIYKPLEILPQILALTESWIVISKPSGWLSIPGRTHDLSSQASPPPVLSTWLKETYGPIWVVHRIDQDTSGVILFARNREAHQMANSWFEKRQVKKTYYCLASGNPPSPILKFSNPISGANSTTQVEVKDRFESCFFAKVQISSGRRHQIRIHLSQNGFPLLGDSRYGGIRRLRRKDGVLVQFERTALHAAILQIPSGETFQAPLPDDFNSWLDLLKIRLR